MFSTKHNQLYIEGVSFSELAETYGTPLYVYSENKLLTQLDRIKTDFLNKYPDTHAAFACKAFCTKYMCRILDAQGFWLDVVSGGELYTALQAAFPPERIEFNGNNKTRDEIEMALDAGVGRIVVDNVSELFFLEEIAKEKAQIVKILFRITPSVSADTHDYISTGKKDSKFGIPLEEDIIYHAVEHAIQSEQFDFLGFHFHVGSQLFSVETHIKALDVALSVILETKKRFGTDVRDINLGGGFGIRYTQDEQTPELSSFIDPLMSKLEEFCAEHELIRPHVSVEPGRYVVGEAGVQLYSIGNMKEIPGVKTYVSIDGGMADNLRPGLYGAKYDAVIANKADELKDFTADICGKCCESTDILIKEIKIAKPQRGDLLTVFSTGAYGYSMANNYNKLRIPAVVAVNGTEHKLVVKRQSYEDLVEREL